MILLLVLVSLVALGLWPLAAILAIVFIVLAIRYYNATHFVPFGIG